MSVFEKMRATLGTYGENDVRSLLHTDHQRIRDLAKELAETDSSARRKSLLRELKPLLAAHSRSEEAAVYVPLTELRTSPDSRLAGSEGMVEHNLADIVLERLANTSNTTSDMWKAHAKVLHESLEHHIKEEESSVVEELGEHFSDEERETMAAQFVRGKAKLLKAAVPRVAARKRAVASAA